MNPVYFETRFRVRDLVTDWPPEFVIVSVFATTGEIWAGARSANADVLLERELRARSAWSRRVEGYSPRTGHAEPSWAVVMPLSDACDVGLRYLQDAIYHVNEGLLSVTYCDDRRGLVRVGSFAERLDPLAPSRDQRGTGLP